MAKLRMHTDVTLDLFDDLTRLLGEAFRNFSDHTCTEFHTVELRRETAARKRREAKRNAALASTNTGPIPEATEKSTRPASKKTSSRSKSGSKFNDSSSHADHAGQESSPADEPLPKQYNYRTPKHHFLGDYPNTIRRYGTTDSYSTESVSISAHEKSF